MAALRTPLGNRAIALAVSLVLVATVALALPQQKPSEFRLDYKPAAFAVKGATVVAAPDRVLNDATVLVRDGVIEAVGPAGEVAIPFDAEVIDGKGLHVYPGFLDLYSTVGVPADAVRSKTGAGKTINYADFAFPRTPTDNRNSITPEFDVAGVLELPEATAEERRGQGFTDLLAAPGGSIAAGQSAFVSLSGVPRREAIVKAPVALHIAFRAGSGRFGEEEDSHSHDHEAMAQLPGPPPAVAQTPAPGPAPATPATPSDAPNAARRRGAGGYPMSLMGEIAHLRQAMLDAEHAQSLSAAYDKGLAARPPVDPALAALHAARAKQLPVWWEANSRDEIHRVLDLADEFGTTAVIVGGREADKVADRLKEEKVPVILRLDFGDEPKVPTEAEYRKKPAEEREESLKTLTNKKTRWSERVAVAKALHDKGVKFAFATDAVGKADTFHGKVRQVVSAGLPKEVAVAALTRDAAEIVGQSKRLGTIEKGKQGHLVILSGPYGEESSKFRYVLADGYKFDLSKAGAATPAKKGGRGGPGGAAGEKKAEPADDAAKEKDEPKKEDTKKDEAKKDEPKKDETKGEPAKKAAVNEDDQAPKTPFSDVATEFDEDRSSKLRTGGDVFIKDITILTGSRGTIPKGSILVRYGKIAAVGENIEAPAGITVVDGTGLVAMPGIIDTHSHMAIAGGVNEMSLSIVPEVRVKDVIRGDDPNIYRQSAGGVTAARLLHGSANTIGGQDAVIKLRYGKPARELLLKDAPQGVKFALGENVTRSTGRFPNTRMGVEATIERAFEEGRAYKAQWQAYGAAKAAKGEEAGPAPRRDLRLEALAGMLDGQIKIHSHCYRSDEILMLLRTAERFNVKVQSLQHVLEGYKVAAEIAEHGASASTFSDWWAYKIEAYDAVPYNAALLTQAGARVCIKSDSEELARHLYLEAAKMVKYGHVTEDQALAMVTLNPALELGLEKRMGSIDVGKDADIAIFNGHPFDGFSRCELTLVDGEVTFQRRESDGGLAPRGVEKSHSAAPTAEQRAKPLDLAPTPDGVYALVGATIHPVTAGPIENGTIVVKDGKIAAVGGADTPVPPGAKSIDAKGLEIWPGMIDAGNVVGLFEIGSLRETQDYSDSAQNQPELRASTALHPDSELIPVTRANGITSTYVQTSGGTIAGQGCLIGLDGWVPTEMVVADRVALNVNIPNWVSTDPEARNRGFGQGAGGGDPVKQRKDRIDALKDLFKQALDYDKVMAEAGQHKDSPKVPDPRLAALVPYAKGERPVMFRAEKRGEILDAIKIAQDLKLKAIISGGGDAWKVPDALKAAKIPVLIAGTLRTPAEASDPYDAPYANPSRLYESGVAFAIRSGGAGSDQGTTGRNLPYEAAMAVAYGLPEEEGLKAVTIYPAQILGVADKVGSLEVGKRADLVVTAGPILQPTTDVKGLFIGGKPVKPESKHTKLYATYQGRLAEVKAGKAKLGLERTAKAPAGTPATGAPAGNSGQGDRR